MRVFKLVGVVLTALPAALAFLFVLVALMGPDRVEPAICAVLMVGCVAWMIMAVRRLP